MNVVKCKNGHFFDGDSYSACPHCGETAGNGAAPEPAPANPGKKGFGWGRGKEKEAQPQFQQPQFQQPQFQQSFQSQPMQQMGTQGSMPGTGGSRAGQPFEAGREPQPLPAKPVARDTHTLDFWQAASHSEGSLKAEEPKKNSEKADEGGAAPVSDSGQAQASGVPSGMLSGTPAGEPQGGGTAPAAEGASALKDAIKRASANTEGKTMSYFSAVTDKAGEPAAPVSDPVVGWLVCVGGTHFGESFPIGAGKNSIGRSGENRIVLDRDSSISRVKHALIVYEPKKRNFYLQPGDSSGLTYLNEEYITESSRLNKSDIIELGDSRLLFVPLCGDSFTWEDYMTKE